MKSKITMILRIVFGLMLLASGSIVVFNLAPPMEYPDPVANNFLMALENTGYILFIVGLLKLLVGLSLVINRFVPLALVIFMPITVNMILFHAFLDITTILPSLIIGFLNVFLLFSNIESYRPLFKPKNNYVRARD
ncbi:hypothetical protein ABES25_16020 [Bacillus gobiensis]|uniref:DoxX family membrane protein n=1 Tax=Bacillus gobiensis TaxID=1441095 RepID=UPI003D1D29D8